MKSILTRIERLEAGQMQKAGEPVIFMRTPDGTLRVTNTNGFRHCCPEESPEDFLRAVESAGREAMVIRLVAAE